MAYMRQNSLHLFLEQIKTSANLINDDDGNDIPVEAAIETLYGNIHEPTNEDEQTRNLETMFNTNCNLKVIEKYILRKTRQIERKFDNFEAAFQRAMNLGNDTKTFELIRTGIIQAYRVVVNVLLEGEEAFVINLPSCSSKKHYGYNSDGTMVPLTVRGYYTIETLPTLLVYCTMFFIFYEALLDVASTNTPNPQRLRSILYLVKAMVKMRTNDSTFYQTIQRIYSFLQIKGDSALISYVDREVRIHLAGDLKIQNAYKGTQDDYLRAEKQLAKVESFNLAYDKFIFGASIKIIIVLESKAAWTPFERYAPFLDRVYTQKDIFVICCHGNSGLDERLFVHAATSAKPKLRVFGVFDGDIAGEEMADSYKVGVSRHYAYLNEILVAPTIVHVAMKPFNLLQTLTVVITAVRDDQLDMYASAIQNFKTNNNAFDHHRDKYENVVLQLLFRKTATASHAPVHITLGLIDDLCHTFGDQLSLKMSAGIDYFNFIDQLSIFWLKLYAWAVVPIDSNKIHELKMIPSFLVNRFISRVNASQLAQNQNIKLHTVQFNARSNICHEFKDAFDTQMMQFSMNDYLLVRADNVLVVVVGLMEPEAYNALKIDELLQKRYPNHQLQPYIKKMHHAKRN